MGRKKLGKVLFTIRIDRSLHDRMEILHGILSRERGLGVIGKYWEGVIKEHLNSMDIIELTKKIDDSRIVDDI